MDTQKGAIKKHARNFQYNWLDDNIFKGWLAPDIKNNKALCMLCNTKIRCNRTDLVRHSKRTKHIEMVKNDESLNNNIDNNSNKISHSDSVKLAEIKLAAFFAEHNIVFYTADQWSQRNALFEPISEATPTVLPTTVLRSAAEPSGEDSRRRFRNRLRHCRRSSHSIDKKYF